MTDACALDGGTQLAHAACEELCRGCSLYGHRAGVSNLCALVCASHLTVSRAGVVARRRVAVPASRRAAPERVVVLSASRRPEVFNR